MERNIPDAGADDLMDHDDNAGKKQQENFKIENPSPQEQATGTD
jgi:hypothetical protein